MTENETCWCEAARELCATIRQTLDHMHESVALIEQLISAHEHDINPSQEVCWRDIAINTEANRVTLAGKVLKLTKSEWRILRYLALNKNQWCSHGRIVANVWGISIDGIGDARLLKTHMCHLRAKIKPLNLIETAQGGYRCYMPEEKANAQNP